MGGHQCFYNSKQKHNPKANSKCKHQLSGFNDDTEHQRGYLNTKVNFES